MTAAPLALLPVLLLACGSEPKPGADSDPDSGLGTGPAEPPGDCPTDGLEVDEGTLRLVEDCSIQGDVLLSGSARFEVDGADLDLDGDLLLEDDAVFAMSGGTLRFVQQAYFEHEIAASDDARVEWSDLALFTRAIDATGNLTMSYAGHDRSAFELENVELDEQENWLLASLDGEAALEATEAAHVPTEIYPLEQSTVRISGQGSYTGIWLFFVPGSVATLDALPALPATWSFGRETEGATGIEYQVDIADAYAGVNVMSLPMSDLTIRDNERDVTIGYYLAEVTTDETIVGLPLGTVTETFSSQGRVLELDNVMLSPVAWQVYVSNSSVADPGVVYISDSTINELGALEEARVEVDASVLQWAVLTTMGQGAEMTVRSSVINSQVVLAAADSRLVVVDSSVWGSLVHAEDEARLVLVGTALRDNVCHDACSPFCVSADVCNPYNPSATATVTADDQGAVIAVRLEDLPGPVSEGDVVDLEGDAFVETADPTLEGAVLTLAWLAEGSGEPVPIAVTSDPDVRSGLLGQLDTTGMGAGTYTLVAFLEVPGEPTYADTATLVVEP
ncbi:MAG: hypothetical protein FJ090_01300 [Deltaproteobacteria bacterium]|nr:hypothetical protein [Deltaproteobacteria bacterium]